MVPEMAILKIISPRFFETKNAWTKIDRLD